MIVLLLLPSTCTVCTVSVSLVTLTTYPSASDVSSAVQLTVIVVAVLLITVREEGAEPGPNFQKMNKFFMDNTYTIDSFDTISCDRNTTIQTKKQMESIHMITIVV